jgi:hypothetical protein
LASARAISLGIFEAKQQLVVVELFGAPAKPAAL